MSNKKRLIQIISGLVVVALIIVVIVAVSGGKNKPSAAAPNTGKASGTITFAEGATANPNWIFPFESCQYCSVDNINQLWITNNYLNQITPFTDTCDISSATTKQACATGVWGAKSTDAACSAVYKYLNGLSSKTTTYTDALWQSGDDGPWRLTTFDNLGNLTFQPNNKYSGPVKAKVAFVKEIAYTTAQAEENDLQAGKLDLGYVDPGVLTSPAPSPGKVGANWGSVASKYDLQTGTIWGFNYAPFNFNKKDLKVAAVNQLYVRQALQESTDQLGVIHNVDKGYGFPSYTALPAVVPAKFSAPISNPYPFNLTSAKKLLSAHGWKIESGVQTCVDPGTGSTQCGAGIAKGYTLTFSFVYASGSPSLTQEITAEVADWDLIGIKVTTSTESFNSVVADCNSGAGFQLCMWGGGWTFSPNYFPTGETLFAVGGGFNPGDYANSTMTTLIKGTDFGHSNLTDYATFASKNLPVLYEPESAPTVETIKTLHSTIGWTGSPLLNFMPEYYYW